MYIIKLQSDDKLVSKLIVLKDEKNNLIYSNYIFHVYSHKQQMNMLEI